MPGQASLRTVWPPGGAGMETETCLPRPHPPAQAGALSAPPWGFRIPPGAGASPHTHTPAPLRPLPLFFQTPSPLVREALRPPGEELPWMMRGFRRVRAACVGASLALGHRGAVSPMVGHTVVFICPLSTLVLVRTAPRGAKETLLLRRLCRVFFFPPSHLILVKYSQHKIHYLDC